MTKKIYEQPELTVLHIEHSISTDVINASVRGGMTDTYFAPEMRGFDMTNDWDAGY